jgi:hypothetical protein
VLRLVQVVPPWTRPALRPNMAAIRKHGQTRSAKSKCPRFQGNPEPKSDDRQGWGSLRLAVFGSPAGVSEGSRPDGGGRGAGFAGTWTLPAFRFQVVWLLRSEVLVVFEVQGGERRFVGEAACRDPHVVDRAGPPAPGPPDLSARYNNAPGRVVRIVDQACSRGESGRRCVTPLRRRLNRYSKPVMRRNPRR